MYRQAGRQKCVQGTALGGGGGHAGQGACRMPGQQRMLRAHTMMSTPASQLHLQPITCVLGAACGRVGRPCWLPQRPIHAREELLAVLSDRKTLPMSIKQLNMIVISSSCGPGAVVVPFNPVRPKGWLWAKTRLIGQMRPHIPAKVLSTVSACAITIPCLQTAGLHSRMDPSPASVLHAPTFDSCWVWATGHPLPDGCSAARAPANPI